jgi:hypothetical protein
MLPFLQALSIVLLAIGVAMSLGHALEFPGKRRLDRDTYFKVQPIYYPGFTIGSIFGEPGAMLAMFVLLIVMPFGGMGFWLTMLALFSHLLAHLVYWTVTHPVNNVWVRDQGLQGAGKAFFDVGGRAVSESDWTALRDRWEWSHVARAALMMVVLIVLVAAAIRPA